MASVVVCGGGAIGLATGLLLARDGHEVTLLEPDAGPPQDLADAWAAWQRGGVAQFHQPHTMLARFRDLLRTELPDVLAALLAAGCTEIDLLAALPPGISDRSPRDGDDRLRLLGGRRPVVEGVLAVAADAEPGLIVRRGAKVGAILPGTAAPDGVPHVAGVVTRDGEPIPAELVVDAMGRRSPASGWLAALGARLPEPEVSGSGFTYYSRFYAGRERPVIRGPANLPLGSCSLLALEGDAGTWSITLFTLTADAPLKALRFPAVFDRVVAAVPSRVGLLDGEPLTGVLPMAGVLNSRRRFAVDGAPAVTGYFPVADAWACTNPSGGRGLSVGLAHAVLLRDTLREGADDPARLARAWFARTDEQIGPWYDVQARADAERIAEMAALVRGEEPPPAGPVSTAFAAAAGRDPDVFRALLETSTCLALPSEVMARPGLRERLAEHSGAAAPRHHGPDRARLLELVRV
jgi:2-polyprenyl-6-methoxyphenol hydroxylase-like FAD-dependent oxidoreductase